MIIRVLGRLRAADGAGVVRIEDRYDTGAADLWSAVTEPERLARWWGRVSGDLRPGGDIRLFVDSAQLDRKGRVEVCEPPHRFRVATWDADSPEGPPFDSVIEVTLTPDGDRTVLVIEVSGLPLDKIAGYGAGWQIHAENLAAELTGRERGDEAGRWAELLPSYQDLAARL